MAAAGGDAPSAAPALAPQAGGGDDIVVEGANGLTEQEAAAAAAAAAAADPEAQPFELSLYLPARPLLPAGHAAAGLPETPSPLKVAVTPQESLNELRITITDSPEGYWLGAFCFRRPASGRQANGGASSSSTSSTPKLGERVDEWTELKTIFEDVPRDKRELHIAHVAYNEADVRAHVQRLRELLSGGQADPSSIGIDGGISVQDAVKNAELWDNEQKNAPEQSAVSSKGSKKKKAAPSSSEADDDATCAAQAKEPFEDFANWKTGDVTSLIPRQCRPERAFPQCLRSFAIASWSPPPHHLRTQGDFLYLHVVTLEGENLFITGCVRGFYINRSTTHRFDPTPRLQPESYASSSLFDTLCAASPLFLANFAKLFQDPVSQRDYFAVVPVSNCLPSHPWLARQHTHYADSLRTQGAFLLTGATSADTLDGSRDWNDEIQSTRELPRSTLQERLMRDRVLNRVYAEFTLAAVRAVPRVAAGEVQAMNPMDKRDAQMFIVNNLFISKGVDGVDLYPHMGGDEAAHVAVSKDVQGIRCLNNLDVEGICLLGTVVIDWMGERWVAQSVVPGLFRRRDDEFDAEGHLVEKPDSQEDTQVIYGGIEGPEIIKDDAGFHALFGRVAKTLHLALHDVKDAKSADHALWLSVDSKGLRGADGRKYALDLARLNPVDVFWLEQDMGGKVIDGEKGALVNADDKYPHRMTLLRQELLEVYWDHELRNWARQELATKAAAKQAEAEQRKAIEGSAEQGKEGSTKKEAKDSDKKEEEPERLDANQFKLAFNPDAFVEFKPAESSEQHNVLVSDENDPTVAAVRSAGKFLRETAIPRLVTDVAVGAHTTQDGASLARQLHARGINVRYLGYVAQLTFPSQRHRLNQELLERAGPGIEGFLAPFRRIVLQEMVVRAVKRIIRRLLRWSSYANLSIALSHVFNCLLGDQVQPDPHPLYVPSPFDGEDAQTPEWVSLTPETMRASIEVEIRARYRFQLPTAYFITDLRREQVLREVCIRCGIQMRLRNYELDIAGASVADTKTNGHAIEASQHTKSAQTAATSNGSGIGKKKKKGGSGAHAAATTADVVPVQHTSFTPADFLNLVPVLKDSTPKSVLAEEAFEAGRVSMSRGDRALGLELMTEGMSFHEQVYGLVHPDVARCYSIFATVLHHYATILAVEQAEKQRQAPEGETVPASELSEQISVANALRYQRQAVTLSERTLGLDHPETLAQYVNLAVLERLEGNVEASLRCQQRVLELLELIHGDDHPEVINALNNIALTLQNARLFERSLKVYASSFEMAERLYGRDSINTAYLAHELSQAYTLAGDLKKAIEIEKEANKVFETRLGKDDNMTKESTTLLNNLAASAVRIAKMDARQKELTRLGLASQAGRSQATRQVMGGGAAATAANAATGSPGATATMQSAASSARGATPDMAGKSLDDLVRFIQGPGASGSAMDSAKKNKGGRTMKKLGQK